MDKSERYLTVLVAVVVPLLQAVSTGLLIGLVAVAFGYLVEMPDIWLTALMVAALSALGVWLSGLSFWRALVKPEPEIATGSEPAIDYYEPPNVRIELIESDGRAGEFINLPVAPSKLTALARGLADGASLTEAAWCGAGNIFTRAEFVQLREEMLRRGLLALNSPSTPARGYRLTRGGEACVRYLASAATTPLLESGGRGGEF